MKAPLLLVLGAVTVLTLVAALAVDPVPTTIDDFFLPGSQPGQSGNLEHPSKCDNCHGGYDPAVEPAFNWRGSMMAQAARDPLFYASLAIANQDAPDSGDLCIRCHSPSGWLEGRSTPTDGSALNNNDREGVQCDFCHKLVDPMAPTPYQGDAAYEAGTREADLAYLAQLTHIPPTHANGMYVADASNAKRGPFTDAAARHQMYYSPFHHEAALCGTCHDVSNPAFALQPDGTYAPNAFGAAADDFDPRTLFPVERTYSEWLVSDFNAADGGKTCQDCHMRDVTGVAANKRGSILRDDLPLHDLTGGNTFIPGLIEQVFPGETNPAALAAGVDRARAMLQTAATVDLTVEGGMASVKVTNLTGHKLPSGYPEGRRIWLNVRFMDAAGTILKESGAYDAATGILTHDGEAKIYEIKPGIGENIAAVVGLPAEASFHFVLNNHVYFDNRIPPKGATDDELASVQSPGIGHTYNDGEHWDVTQYAVPDGTVRVEATLLYQATSKEYVEFLLQENQTNDWGQVLYDMWNASGKAAPEVMATAWWGGGQPPPEEPVLVVESIVVGHGTRGKSEYGTAVVMVVDADGTSVDGATVSGQFNDGSTASGTTDGFGRVELKSGNAKNPPSTWCFEVTQVSRAGYAYDAGSTAQDCEAAPKGAFEAPVSFTLDQNHPNPFNPSTAIGFTLRETGPVELTVHDLAGRLVDTIVHGTLAAGSHTYLWNAGGRASGTYLYRLRSGDEVRTRQMMLIR